MTENDKKMFPTSDKQLDKKMSDTAISTTTPSMSLKRKQSIDNNVENENYLPKKRRESAIRSENNLKMLIKNGQIDTSKQKESPKKVLSLGKEARTETLATLISAGKFDKLDKLYIKTVEAASNGSKEDVETSDSEPEPLPSPQLKTKLECKTLNELKPTDMSTTNDLNPTTKVQNTTNTSNLPNPTTITKEPNLTNTFNVSNSTNATKVQNPTTTTEVPNAINIYKMSNPESTTKVLNELNTNNNVKSNKITTHVSDLDINKKVSNTTNKNTRLLLGDIETLNTREPVDNTTAEVSPTNNLDQNEEENTDFVQSRSSLDAEVKTLHNLILTLAPDTDDNGSENFRTSDIKYIEDIYQKVLSVKSKLDSVYKQRSIELRKSFESIQLVVPELKRGLVLPTLEELKENSLVNGEAPKLLPSPDEK